MLSDKVISSRFSQLEKAPSPMDVISSDSDTFVRLVQP